MVKTYTLIHGISANSLDTLGLQDGQGLSQGFAGASKPNPSGLFASGMRLVSRLVPRDISPWMVMSSKLVDQKSVAHVRDV